MCIISGMCFRTFALNTVIPLRRAGQTVGFTSDCPVQLIASHGVDTDDDHAVRKFRGGWNDSVSVAESLNRRGL